MKIRGRLAAGLVVIGVLVAGCAGQAVPGTGIPGPSGPAGTPVASPGCRPTAGADDPTDTAPPSTPVGSPMISISQGTNAWIASDLTQPYDMAIYPDGTAIRAEGLGTLDDPLPELTIGRLDSCLVAAALAELDELAVADLGDPGITDQGTTTVTAHAAEEVTVLEVYALGIGDEYVANGQQRGAREQLTALIGALRDGMTQTDTWTPDRVRVSRVGNPTDPESIATWPLPGSINERLAESGRVPCGEFAGPDAAAIMSVLGARPAGSSWTDGSSTAVLAVGVLVPGQGCGSS